jgi:hypothetical protein
MGLSGRSGRAKALVGREKEEAGSDWDRAILEARISRGFVASDRTEGPFSSVIAAVPG